MNHKLFKLGYLLKRPQVLNYYNNFQKSQWKSFEWLKNNQEKQLRKLIHFVYENVPYYTELMDNLNIKTNDISTIKDLEKLTVLTKKIIKENWQKFKPKNIDSLEYLSGSTGGSTGTPLKYKMSREDYERGVALLYRGWGYGGYELGNKVAIIAGSSLIPNKKSTLKNKIQELFLNHKHYSSFEMSKDNLYSYFYDINRWKPDFIYGYASSIYLFAKFIQKNHLNFNFTPKAIITTSEKLFGRQRTLIERIFKAKVFEEYGVNDGGVSAHECEKHNGMHIDMERSILEVISDGGEQIINKKGKILATSLYNYALPFIRYDTGDLGTISDLDCTCGRKAPLFKEIFGRVTDLLKLNDVIIGSPVLTVLMGKFDIEQYQIIQNNSSSIICKIVKGKNFVKKDEEFIRKSFFKHVGKIDINFNYVELHISVTSGHCFR